MNEPAENQFQSVCKTDEIPEGEGRSFEIDERIIAVFNDQGTFRAIDDLCPHMGASLSTGHMEDSVVACPWHAWRFDTRDGTWCENRRVKIDAFDLKIEGDQILVNPTPRPKEDRPKEDRPKEAE